MSIVPVFFLNGHSITPREVHVSHSLQVPELGTIVSIDGENMGPCAVSWNAARQDENGRALPPEYHIRQLTDCTIEGIIDLLVGKVEVTPRTSPPA